MKINSPACSLCPVIQDRGTRQVLPDALSPLWRDRAFLLSVAADGAKRLNSRIAAAAFSSTPEGAAR